MNREVSNLELLTLVDCTTQLSKISKESATTRLEKLRQDIRLNYYFDRYKRWGGKVEET